MIKWFFNDHIAHIFQVIASADMEERKQNYQANSFLHFVRTLLRRRSAVFTITSKERLQFASRRILGTKSDSKFLINIETKISKI